MLNACSFGVFMENAEPGMMEGMADGALGGNMSMGNMDMDTTLGPAHQSWALQKNDLSFPCDDSAIGPQYISGCWRMQMVVLAREVPFSQSIPLCNNLTDPTQKDSCFVGFADGYVAGPDMDTKQIFSACGYASDEYWKNICLVDFVQRAYLNGYSTSVTDPICAQIGTDGKAACEAAEKGM
jgi:hypothetical protein